jgi:hypothetical protein
MLDGKHGARLACATARDATGLDISNARPVEALAFASRHSASYMGSHVLSALAAALGHARAAMERERYRSMPTGPKGEKRPADVIGAAIRIARIATGEEPEQIEDDGKDPAAKALGKKGGAARAANMTPERRAEIAKKAAAKRWGK